MLDKGQWKKVIVPDILVVIWVPLGSLMRTGFILVMTWNSDMELQTRSVAPVSRIQDFSKVLVHAKSIPWWKLVIGLGTNVIWLVDE